MIVAEFHRLYNGLWARNLMLRHCCDFWRFSQKFAVLFAIVFAVIFYCSFRSTCKLHVINNILMWMAYTVLMSCLQKFTHLLCWYNLHTTQALIIHVCNHGQCHKVPLPPRCPCKRNFKGDKEPSSNQTDAKMWLIRRHFCSTQQRHPWLFAFPTIKLAASIEYSIAECSSFRGGGLSPLTQV